ncbi:hypothetical protein CJU89_4191 [Yarrowia sp. B02]|nr:hypothetical protein CJU89_4191 [Yarrowia sp. B02]
MEALVVTDLTEDATFLLVGLHPKKEWVLKARESCIPVVGLDRLLDSALAKQVLSELDYLQEFDTPAVPLPIDNAAMLEQENLSGPSHL